MKIRKSVIAALLSGVIALTSLSFPSFAEEKTTAVVLPTGGVDKIKGTKTTAEQLENSVNYLDNAPINAINTGVEGKDGGCTYGYDCLSVKQRTAYTAIDDAMLLFISSGDYSGKDFTAGESIRATFEAMSESEILITFKAFLLDNPQYYWISGSFSFEVSGSLNVYISQPYLKAADRVAIDADISAQTDKWVKNLNAYSSDYEKVLALHDLIIDEVDYAYSSPGVAESAEWAHNIVGVMNGKKTGAVCEGYAEAYHYILNILGIESIAIVGTSTGGVAHEWNAVKLGSAWYLVDVTWDDLTSDYAYGRYYDYFCMPESKFKIAHTPYSASSSTRWCYSLPGFANDETMTYYKQFSSYADSSVTSATAASFVEGALTAAMGDYVYFVAPNATVMSLIAGQFAAADRYDMLVSQYGIFMATNNTQVDEKATAIALDKETLTLGRGTTAALTATLTPSTSDDKLSWSCSDLLIASVSGTGKTATVTAKRAGTATITVNAREGNVSASCTVTVSPSGDSDFTDEAEEATEENVIWVNGKDIKNPLSLNKTCQISFIGMYSGGTITTLVTPATEEYDTGAEIAALYNASGKLTMSSDLQKEIKALATAKFAKGIITVTAGKISGKARVWVFEMKDKRVINDTDIGVAPRYYDVSVLMGSSAVAVNSEYNVPADGKVAKSTSDKASGVAVGDTAYFYINAMGNKFDKTTLYKVSPNETFTVKLKKAEDSNYLDLEYTSGREFKVTGLSLKDGKPTTVTVVITSNMTGKTANFTIGVHKPIYLFDSISDIELRANTSSEVAYAYETFDGGSATTDSVKAFVSTASTADAALTLANAKATLNAITKTSAITASFKNSKLVVKAAKTAVSGTTYYIYLCGVGKYGIPVVTSFAVTIK